MNNKYDLIVVGGGFAGVAASVANKNKTSTRDVDIVKVQEILRREGFEI